MSLTETVVEGTIQPDGTLVLDKKPSLPAGRVTVVLRQQAEVMLPKDDPFWQRMSAIWAIPKRASDGGGNTLSEALKMREEWDEHQQAIERLQEECRSPQKTTP